jgi:RNA polymerase sigma-70 factor (ECF subfamily)
MKTIVFRKSLLLLKIENRFTEYEKDRHDDVIVWRDDLTAEYLDKAIKNLPDGYRAVFLLAEVDGYHHKEIAEMLGISEGTSKSQLYHAKKQLQKILHELRP